MQIILLEKVKNLGEIGETVNVKRGHARNYLIRFGKALTASKENIEYVNKKKIELNKKNTDLKKSAKKIFDVINNQVYRFNKMAMENDKLYGSVKPKEIVKNISKNSRIEIKPSAVDLNKEINKIGSYTAKINLHAEIEAKILIEVVKEGDKAKK